jgi:acyl carrier protein
MSTRSILSRIQEIFRSELDDDDLVVELDTNSDDIVDWDSLAHVRLITAVEREFDIEFELSEIEQIVTVGDFVDRTEKHVS